MSTNGRNGNGRFTHGNPGGPGRPRRPVEHEYLARLNAVVTLDVWQQIVQRAAQDALEGDSKARDFVAKYVLGDDRVSLLELAINDRAGMSADVVIGGEAARQKLRAGILRLQCALTESDQGQCGQSNPAHLTEV
jgi:hypothetical protein